MSSGDHSSSNSTEERKRKDTASKGEAGARKFRNNILLLSLMGVLFFGAVYWFDLNKSSTRNAADNPNPFRNNPTANNMNPNTGNMNQGMTPNNTTLPPHADSGVISKIAEFAKQNVVNISVMRMSDPGQGQQNQKSFTNPFSGNRLESIGSGIVVTYDGYVLTNYHVVENANDIVVTVFSGKGAVRHSAEIVKLDEKRDLALVKIKPKIRLSPAALNNDREIKIAEDVLAIGSPFGLDQTVSKGIISAKNKSVTIDQVTHKNLLQTDAAINQGNSGGPLVDMAGYVIGVNTAIFTPTAAFVGIGFAVPTSQARNFMEDIIILPKIVPDLNSHVPVAKNQQRMQSVPVAMNPAQMVQAGLLTTRKTAPTIKAGAVAPHGNRGSNCSKCHDILPANNTQPVAMMPGTMANAQNVAMTMNGNNGMQKQFLSNPARNFPGNMNGNRGITNMRNTRQGQPGMNQMNQGFWLGAHQMTLTQNMQQRFDLNLPGGVLLTQVPPGTIADKAGLRAGDVIFKVDGKKVLNTNDLKMMTHNFNGDVRFSVLREGVKENINVSFSRKQR